MKIISGEIKISEEEMETYLAEITEGDFETVLAKVVMHFIPKRDKVEKQVKELSKKSVLSFLMPKKLLDHKGGPVAEIGPLQEDLDGHVIYQMSQNMSFLSFFLRQAIEELQVKFGSSVKDIVDCIYKFPIFDSDKKPIIEEGLKAYFENNHIVSVHLLIPQIEDALRNLVEKAGGSIYKLGRTGVFFLRI